MAKKQKKDRKQAHEPARHTIRLGIDLGGTKILAGVVDDQGRILGSAKRKTRAERGVDEVITRIVKTAHDAVSASKLDLQTIKAIGIGAPGVADYRTGVIEFAPNLNNWVNVPLGPRLEKELGLPVIVENDVNAGTYGEVTVGAAAVVLGWALIVLGGSVSLGGMAAVQDTRLLPIYGALAIVLAGVALALSERKATGW